MTHYDVILTLFFFRFIANVGDLYWKNFLVVTMNRRAVIRTFFAAGKNDPLPG